MLPLDLSGIPNWAAPMISYAATDHQFSARNFWNVEALVRLLLSMVRIMVLKQIRKGRIYIRYARWSDVCILPAGGALSLKTSWSNLKFRFPQIVLVAASGYIRSAHNGECFSFS